MGERAELMGTDSWSRAEIGMDELCVCGHTFGMHMAVENPGEMSGCMEFDEACECQRFENEAHHGY